MNTTLLSPKDPRERAELDEALGLLADALAVEPTQSPSAMLRQRLLGRVADSAARHQGMVTVRRRHMREETPTQGVTVRWLYDAGTRARRAGEPQRLAIVDLVPGTRLTHGLGLAGRHSEWLVVRGQASVDGTTLGFLDHHGRAASQAEPVLASREGATLYVRDSDDEPTPAGTTREAPEPWEDFAPGIRRRVLWRSGNASAYLARAHNGAAVPPHSHKNDEECLMIEGDLFIGDILVREGEFQLAPAGVHHGLVQAASDCLLYVRGDAELDILPA
jgi:quercetin dioxygenase-like cupin family protein